MCSYSLTMNIVLFYTIIVAKIYSHIQLICFLHEFVELSPFSGASCYIPAKKEFNIFTAEQSAS